jgi:ectoine hydroxylase-related dioxygenase (phytanoyl-CoA dioxygenase family)
MPIQPYSPEQIQSLVEDGNRDGFVILRDHFSREKLQVWAEKFPPLLEEQIEREKDSPNRGAQRFYVTLPFTDPYADRSIYEDEDVLAIVEGLAGKDYVMCQLATDTPLLGSDYQELHRDTPPLFPEWSVETPSFQLAVNFPLVDVTPEMGPFEVARGTHTMTRAQVMSVVERGEVKLEAICLSLGDVMIRDVRGLHRGTPNRTNTPRPMVVIGYSRKWLNRPEVSIQIPRSEVHKLSERGRRMLRFNPIVESIEEKPTLETYKAFAY